MIRECIILCGGLGTRLQQVLPGIPKVLAPVAGKPFLYHVMNHLQHEGIQKFILATGYGHELVQQFVSGLISRTDQFATSDIVFSTEHSALGTGGAINLALSKSTAENILIVNGDTLYHFDLGQLETFHLSHNSICTIAVKPMFNFDRYGVIEIGPGGIVNSFREKKFYPSGLINAGAYLLNATIFRGLDFPGVYSFEKDFFEQYIGNPGLRAQLQDEYFIDIGIPGDLQKAELELSA